MSEPAPAFLPDWTTCERLHLTTLHPAPEPAPALAKPVCVKALLESLGEVGTEVDSVVSLVETRISGCDESAVA